jgi:hypothetical protein
MITCVLALEKMDLDHTSVPPTALLFSTERARICGRKRHKNEVETEKSDGCLTDNRGFFFGGSRELTSSGTTSATSGLSLEALSFLSILAQECS